MTKLLGMLCMTLAVSLIATADTPTLQVASGGMTLSDVAPGTTIVWLAIVLDRENYAEKVTISRGSGVASSNRNLQVPAPVEGSTNAIWAVSTIDGEAALASTTPGMSASTRPIDVSAGVGQTTFAVVGARPELLYVRNGKAWVFSGADGGAKDGDGAADGTTTVSLAAMSSFYGDQQPPATIAAGDLILLIDFPTRRSSAIRVTQ